MRDDFDNDDDAGAASARPVWTRPGTLAAAGLLVMVVAAGIGIAAFGGGSTGDRPGELVTGDETGSVDQEATVPDGTVLTEPPAGVEWVAFAGTQPAVAVPVSAEHGPATDTDTVAYGYSRSPEGALIAASQLVVRCGVYVDREVWEPTIETQFVAGEARDALLSQMRVYDKAMGDSTGVPADGDLSQYAGFVYKAWSADTAVIELFLASGASTYAAVTVTLMWVDGDWRMQAPPEGDWSLLMRRVADLTGVVPWGDR